MPLQIVKDSWLDEEYLLEVVGAGDVITLENGSSGIVSRLALVERPGKLKPDHKVYFTNRPPLSFLWDAAEGGCWVAPVTVGSELCYFKITSIKRGA